MTYRVYYFLKLSRLFLMFYVRIFSMHLLKQPIHQQHGQYSHV